MHSVCGASLRELFGGTPGGEAISESLLGRDGEDVLDAFKGGGQEGVVDEAFVKNNSPFAMS